MIVTLALALAAEIGANAPPELKPCDRPVIEKQAPRTDPQYARLTHIRKLKTDCGEIAGPLAILFPPKEVSIDYSTPDGRSFEALLQTVPDEAQAVSTEADAPRSYEAIGRGGDSCCGVAGLVYVVGMDARPLVAIPAVPEPYTVYMVAVGLLALVWRARA